MWVNIEQPEDSVVDKSPFDGHPDFVMVAIGSKAERAATIATMLDEAAQAAPEASDADRLHGTLLDVMRQVIAECAATTWGVDDPMAADIGWSLAESLMADASVNVRLIQLLGDVADLCAAHDAHEEVGA